MQVPGSGNDEEETPNAGPSLYGSVLRKPDLEAARQRLARTTGLTVGAVRANPDEIERQAKMQAIDPSQLRLAAPRTSSFLAVPENADVAHDNVENMSAFETMFRMAKGTGQAIAVAPFSRSQGLFGALTASNDLSAAINPFTYLFPDQAKKNLEARRAFEKQFNAEAKIVQEQIRPKGLSMAEDAYYSGIESGTQSIMSALMGPAAGLAMMGAQTSGAAYQRGLEEGLSPLKAGVYGTTQGGIEILTEKNPFLGLIKDVKLGTPFFETLKNYLVREQIGEQGAEFLQGFVDWVSLPSNEGKTIGEFLQERVDAVLPTAIATAVGGAFTASVYKAADYTARAADRRMAKIEQAAFVKDRTDKLTKLAEVDKLLQRAPETFQQFIDEVAADGAITDLYIDRDVLLQAVTETGIEAPAEVAAQLATAAAPGSDIRIPAGEFMTYLAKPEVYAKLADHLKSEPGGMTYAEAQAQGQETLAMLKETFEKSLNADLQTDEFLASRDRVQEKIVAELKATKRFSDTVNDQYAFIGAQMVAVTAKRAGMTPEELLAKKPLSTKAGEARAGKKVFAEGAPRVAPTYDRANDPDGYRDMAEQMVMEEQGYTEEELADPQTKREFDIQTRAKFDQIIENNYTPPSTGESNDQRRARSNQAQAGTVPDGGRVSGGTRLLDEQGGQDIGLEQSGDQSQFEAPLRGAPTRIKVGDQFVTVGPFAPAREAARKYMESTGREYNPVQTYQKVDEEFARRVAEAYADMKDDPTSPEVVAAYQAMIEETVAQWQFIKETGLVVEFIEGADPYGNPWNAILDVVNNNHLYVFPTDTGFGDGVSAADYDVARNPLLAFAPGEFFNGKPVRYNDIFRAVHDYFGHIKDGVGFRANGEENAYRSHGQMYSPLALRAMGIETRVQNSYLNFGPHGEFNLTADPAETRYAPQKVGLVPDWAIFERLDDPEGEVLNQDDNALDEDEDTGPDAEERTEAPVIEGQSTQEGNKHGLMPHLRVDVDVEIPLNAKPLFTAKTNNKNAVRQINAIDEVLGRHPDAGASVENWNAMMADALASNDLPAPPYAFIENINNNGSEVLLSSMSEGQIADADHGFENAASFRDAYINGRISIEQTGRLFLWSFLSRGVSPYTQESMFIDAFDGINEWISAAADGSLRQRLPQYLEWAASVAPKGSGQPGSGSVHNLNAFGATFMLKMSEDANDGTGRSRFQVLHDLMCDPNSTGKSIRREFLKMGEGVGIDNKVVSFTLLVAGFTDVMVLDRVQMRELWNDGRFDGINLYDGYKTDGASVTGSMLSSLTYGARGLLIYEAIEKTLQAKIQALYTNLGRPEAASVGRYHWETWVASSNQEASHATIDAILKAASGSNNPMEGVTAKEGEFGAYAYGARYGRNGDGVPYFLYSVPNAGDFRFTVPQFRAFLKEIKKPANGVIPRPVSFVDAAGNRKTGAFSVKDSGNRPWYDRDEVNREALAALAAKIGEQYETEDLRRANVGAGIDATITNRPAADQVQDEGVLNQYDPGLAGFRSTLYDTVRDKGPNKATASDWKGLLDNATGVKKEEIEDTGLYEFLDIKGFAELNADGQPVPQMISKSDVLNFIEQNGVRLSERILSQDARIDFDDPRFIDLYEKRFEEQRAFMFNEEYYDPTRGWDTIIGDVVDGLLVPIEELPGWPFKETTNYKEYIVDYAKGSTEIVQIDGEDKRAYVLLDETPYDDMYAGHAAIRKRRNELRAAAYREYTLTDVEQINRAHEYAVGAFRNLYSLKPKFANYTLRGGVNEREMLFSLEGMRETFEGSHWDDSTRNVMAHARVSDRTDENGDRVLYINEVQSDWHQQGNKYGYIGKIDATKKVELMQRLMDAKIEQDKKESAAQQAAQQFFRVAEQSGLTQILAKKKEAAAVKWTAARNLPVDNENPNARQVAIQFANREYVEADDAIDPFESYQATIDIGASYGTAWKRDSHWATFIRQTKTIPGFENAFPDGRLGQLWAAARNANQDYQWAISDANDARAALHNFVAQQDAVPDAPLKKGWPKLVMRRLIQYAVENNYDRVAITPGKITSEVSSGDERAAWFYEKNLKNITNDLIKKSGQKIVEEQLYNINPKNKGAPEPAIYTGRRFDAEPEYVKAKFFDINDALRDEVAAGLSLFQKKEQEGPFGTFSPTTGVITLNKNANLSTWLHELGHYNLELLADLATGPDAVQSIKDDMEQVLAWFSEDLDTPITLEMWNAMSLNDKREYHEKFARGFELYLFEGKAPTPELRNVFKMFADWMKEIYKQMRALNVEINDEVRGVFDRMIATEEAIKAAEENRGMAAAFTNRPVGMSEDEWDAYQRIQQDATDSAIDDLQTRSLRDMKWISAQRTRIIYELQRSARELYKSVKAEVEAEVMQEPVYMAREYLKYGRLYGDEPSPDSRKLDLDTLKSMYPEASGVDLTPLTRGGKYGLTQQDGVHPDVVAEMFGFESGDAMVRQLLTAEPMNNKITAITDKRMLERYGDIKDQAALETAADEMIHNDARARAVHTELSYAEKVLGKKTPLIQAARAFAQNLVDRTILRNLRPDLAESAAERARRAAMKALKNDDMAQFAAQKRNELVHIQTVRALAKAKQELTSTLSFFARIVTAKDEAIAKRRDLNLVMAARAVLAAHGIGRPSQNPMEYIDRVLAYDPEVGNQLKLDVAAATIGATGDFKDLTVDQMRALRDTVQQLWDLAKSSKEIEVGADKVAMDDAVEQLIKELEAGPDPKYVGMGMEQAVNDEALMLPGGGLGLPILGVSALLRRVEAWAGLKGEAWSRFTFRLVSNAANQYRAALQSAVTRYREILEPVAADMKQQKIDGKEINYTFGADGTGIGMAELLGALRHTGNPSNLKKLLIGRGWADINPDGSMDTTRWDAFLDRMHKEGILQKRHWDFIQAEWDLHDSLKPQAQKAHKAMYGRYFAEVTAAEVTTPFGTYKGGYVPAATDPNLVDDAALRKEAEDMFGGGSALFPAPANGMTKSRIENYNEPLALNIGMVPSQIARALRFAYLGPAIRDVNRLLRRKDLRQVLKGYDPVAITDVLMPWLERSASQQVVTPAKGRYGKLVDKGLKAIRSNTSLALLFFNLSNTLQNITGLAPATLRTGKRNLLTASMTYLRDPTGTAQRITDLSVMMAQRNNTQFDELQAEMRNIILRPNLFQKAQDWSAANAQWLQRGLQNVLDMMVWQAAYNKAIQEQNTDPVGFADSAVRETMGSFGAEDVSIFETGTATSRAFTLFYSYFNTQANLLGNEFAKAPTAARGFEVFMLGVWAPALGAMVIAQLLKGNLFDDGDDDEEDGLMTAIEMFFAAPLAYMAGFIPIIGPTAIAIANTFDDKPFNDRLSLSPVFSVVESAIKLPKAYADWASGEDISGGKMIRDTAMLVTLATGVPASAIARPVSYAVSVAEGDVEPTDPLDYARGLVTGVASNPSKE